MKPLAGLVAVLLLLGLPGCARRRAVPAKPSPDGLRILSYNDRTAFADQEDARIGNAWTQRLPLARRMLRELEPDVMGVQEATDRQIQDLAPGYAVLRKEELALLYRADRLEALDGASFELGAYGNPDPWGPRWALWQRFRKRGGGAPFVVFVTHLSTAADQIPQARAALDAARKLAAQGQPVAILGDFNFDASALFLEYGFRDAGPAGQPMTFHAFQGGVGEARLDFIAATALKPLASGLYLASEPRGGHTVFPSDHYPLWATFEWPNP